MSQGLPQRFLILEVITPHYHAADALKNMAETESLVHTFGGRLVTKSVQHRVRPHPATYIGPGKLLWLTDTVKSLGIDVVVLNSQVKSAQLFRIEKTLWDVNPKIAVWDRIDLILNIFDRHADTREAKLQIELARISHQGPRIYGLGRTLLSRQGGGIGTRGIGETNIEKERRLMKDRSRLIQKEINRLLNHKSDRLNVRQDLGLGPVALIGYTSAGKTTLFNALTGKKMKTHSGLFTTLDTVVGRMKNPNQSVPVLISDTIGFIENLPPVLIDAFKTTLLESLTAKLILHVIDASDPMMKRKIDTVQSILAGLGITKPVMFVFNKCDLLTIDEMEQIKYDYFGDATLFISAHKKMGLDHMKQAIVKRLENIP